MAADPTPAPAPVLLHGHDVEHALLAERLRLHRRVLSSSAVSSALLALGVLALEWPQGSHPGLTGWAAVLAAVLGLRVAVGQLHDRGRRPPLQLLQAYRLTFLLHGLAWAGLGLLVSPPGTGTDLVGYALCATAAGALVITAFDLAAAGLFALPVLVPALQHLFARGFSDATAVLVLTAMIGGIALLASSRAQRVVAEAVRLRVRDADRADQAARLAAEAEAARRALDEKHRLMALLMRTTRQGYWLVDADGITQEVNPALCRLLGREAHELVGRPAQDFFDGDDRLRLQRELAARREGLPGSYEITIRRPDGSVVHCRNDATPIHDAEGRHVGSMGVWTDITESRRSQEALHTYALVANSINDTVSVVDENLVYRLVNDAWCRSMKVERERVIGRSITDFFALDEGDARVVAMRECIRTQQPRTVRDVCTEGPRAGIATESVYYPYPERAGGQRCVVIVSRDVTEEERSRRRLAETAKDLAGTLNATGDAIFASDAPTPGQPVRFVNEQMLQMWGIPPELAPTLTPAQIMAHALPLFADPVAEGRRIAQIVAEDRPDEAHVALRDGRVLLRRCIPWKVAGRTMRVWSFRDITAEQRALQLAQASDAEHRALLDAFPGYIFTLDEQLRYTYVNDRLAALLGRPVPQLVGRPLREVAGDDAAAECEREFRRALAGERAVAERRFPATPTHPALDLEITYVVGPLREGRRLRYAFGVDVGARKHAEQALIAARDDADRANRAKTQFLAQMSHELRTPMNAILGLGQLLQSDARQPLAASHREYLDAMMRGARHLLALINELLDLGSIEAGRLQVERREVELVPLVAECLELLRPLAQERSIRLPAATGLAAPSPVWADPRRLQQVLLNLLGNAIKYNRPGGQVGLELHARDDGVEIVVTDTGPGIAPEQRERLFRPFERGDAARSSIEGTGIGLALSQRLVAAMGGRIGVDSRVGSGSRFWVRLPAVQPAAPARGEQLVLYVEDNPVNAFIMEAMFERLPGRRLVCASRAAEGLRLAAEQQPALILLDMQLPDLEGVQVLRTLRADPRTASVPVVAVSANTATASVQAALDAGAADYLAKPIDLERLEAVVRRATGGAALSEARLPGTGT